MLLHQIIHEYGEQLLDFFIKLRSNFTYKEASRFSSKRKSAKFLSFLLLKRFVNYYIHDNTFIYNINHRNILRRLYFSFYVEHVYNTHGQVYSDYFLKVLTSGIFKFTDRIITNKLVSWDILTLKDEKVCNIRNIQYEDSIKTSVLPKRTKVQNSKIEQIYKEEEEDMPHLRNYVVVNFEKIENRIFTCFFKEIIESVFDGTFKHLFEISCNSVSFNTTLFMTSLNVNIISENTGVEKVNQFIKIFKGMGIIEKDVVEGNYRYNKKAQFNILKGEILCKALRDILNVESYRIFRYIKDNKFVEDKDLMKGCLIDSTLARINVFKVYEKGLIENTNTVKDGRNVNIWGFELNNACLAVANILENMISRKIEEIRDKMGGMMDIKKDLSDVTVPVSDLLYMCKMHFILTYDQG